MRFLIDESADARLREHLNATGHDATSIAVDHRHSLPDEEVLAIAVRERRVLITQDRDFGELIFRHKLPHCGVIFFRTPPATLQQKIAWLEQVIREHAGRINQFIVVTERARRVRPSATPVDSTA